MNVCGVCLDEVAEIQHLSGLVREAMPSALTPTNQGFNLFGSP